MNENKEIEALMHLIDDPDEIVYQTVSEKIISLGRVIIPNLEHLWETSEDVETQEKIEMLIHRVHWRELVEEVTDWKNGEADLLQGTLLIAKYHYPDINSENIIRELEKMRRNIWLELNNYLTSFEQINVFNSILFNYFKHKGTEVSYDAPDAFLINKTLELKKGNAISNGILYLLICELLDIPVKAVNIPRQFLLGYFDTEYQLHNIAQRSQKIAFYIDPLNGQMYAQKDIENYLKKLSVPAVPSYFKPLTNKRIIQFLAEEISKCYIDEKYIYKKNELLEIANLINE